MAKPVEVNDHVWQKILRNVSQSSKIELQVGILQAEAEQIHPESKITMGEIARIQEYGSTAAGVPARPFLSRAMNKNNGQVKTALNNAARALVNSTVAYEMALRSLGNLMVATVINTIASNVPPPLAPATVDKKGHALALYDSGALMGAISALVTRRTKTSDYAEMALSVPSGDGSS